MRKRIIEPLILHTGLLCLRSRLCNTYLHESVGPRVGRVAGSQGMKLLLVEHGSHPRGLVVPLAALVNVPHAPTPRP